MTMPGESQIRHTHSHSIDTFRDVPSPGLDREEEGVTASTLSTIMSNSSPAEGMDPVEPSRYVAPMTTSAKSVINAIDERRPGMTAAKKHLLLFFAQGHHLAWADEPLFAEPLYATDRGVTVPDNTDPPAPITSEAALGTITNVVVRYSSLSPADLRTLIQASQPWRLACKASDDTRIEWAWLTDWFRRPDETDDPDDERPNLAESAEAEAYLASRHQP